MAATEQLPTEQRLPSQRRQPTTSVWRICVHGAAWEQSVRHHRAGIRFESDLLPFQTATSKRSHRSDLSDHANAARSSERHGRSNATAMRYHMFDGRIEIVGRGPLRPFHRRNCPTCKSRPNWAAHDTAHPALSPVRQDGQCRPSSISFETDREFRACLSTLAGQPLIFWFHAARHKRRVSGIVNRE